MNQSTRSIIRKISSTAWIRYIKNDVENFSGWPNQYNTKFITIMLIMHMNNDHKNPNVMKKLSYFS